MVRVEGRSGKLETWEQYRLRKPRTVQGCGSINTPDITGTVAKLAMRQPFVLFKGLTFQKLCLPG
ncbi:TPA: hypothetical protein MIH13_27770, partial [Klebsiella pneumoniae]|nr:hypothetical protein [Klebsiella pneumoniae]